MSESSFGTALRARGAAVNVSFSDPQAAQLETYYSELARWNARINLTALPLDGFPAETLDRLLIEPALAASTVPDTPLAMLDIGSGGGSPAIPLKILRPHLRLTMVEMKHRKAAFLRDVSSKLGLAATRVLTDRFETVADSGETADVISLRAVRIDDALTVSIAKSLTPSGVVLFFGSIEQPGLVGLSLVSTHQLPAPSARLTVYRRDGGR